MWQTVETAYFVHNLPHMTHGFYYITGTRFTLSSNHGGSLADAPQGLTQITRPANKRHGEFMFADMNVFICRGKNFTFVNIIDPQRF
jgi:hypothetical protein